MNRKNLTAAVLAGLAGVAGIASTAIANHNEVFLNPDGLGEVLIYPYYTVNNGNATVMSVVNTTNDAKAVKVRFKEGENSREVLDFNLYLSAWDVWYAAIVNDGGTPTLIIPDNSCTVPYLYLNDSDGDGEGEQAFLDFDYTGDKADGGSTDIARAAEGHMEIIEMGEVWDDKQYFTKARPYGTETAVTHIEDKNGNQVPKDCELVNEQWSTIAGVKGLWIDKGADADMDDLTGGLFGSAAIINVLEGTLFSYDAKALGEFSEDNLHVKPGSSFPSLNDGQSDEAIVFGTEGETDQFDFTRGIDAVSAVFMHDQVMNEYNINADLGGESEWVLTFPTKGWYVDPEWAEEDGGEKWTNVGTCAYNSDHDNNVLTPNLVGTWVVDPAGGGAKAGDWGYVGSIGKPAGLLRPANCATKLVDTFYGSDPFTSTFDGEACEEAGFQIWDTNENAQIIITTDDLPIVSPPPPDEPDSPDTVFELCYEVSVLRFGDSNIFDSRNFHTVNATADAGWARIDFGIEDKNGPVHQLDADNGYLIGLPVTGFWASKYSNEFSFGPGVLSNYGGLFDHKGSTSGVGEGSSPAQ